MTRSLPRYALAGVFRISPRLMMLVPVAGMWVMTGCGENAFDSSPRQISTLTLTSANPLAFSALGDTIALTVVARDSLGVIIPAPSVTYSSSNAAVARVEPNGGVVSAGEGSAFVFVRGHGGAVDSAAVVVNQVPESLDVARTDTLPILLGALWAPVAIRCRVLDRNGFPLARDPSVLSRQGTIMGSTCATMVVRQSGADTLTFTSDSFTTSLSYVMAARPIPDARVGAYVAVDSVPAELRLWAPSTRRNSGGLIELYVTGYPLVPDSNGVGPGSLHRLVSSDGFNFQYDGVALAPETNPCGLTCSGVENVVVMPRMDAPGWRMLYAAGSSGTYGWQVFSAVSTDERTWTPEPGVRISNGGNAPPDPPVTPPWPAGEGMIVRQLDSGEWQLIMGAYEPVTPSENKFQLVEYRSTDQLTWSYVGPVLTTRELPAEAQRSIYSPGLVEFAPGLWRLFFAGDDTNLPGGRSRIFSAVSRDLQHWQFEGEILGGPDVNLYYSALVGSDLYFLRQDTGGDRQLARAVLSQP